MAHASRRVPVSPLPYRNTHILSVRAIILQVYFFPNYALEVARTRVYDF